MLVSKVPNTSPVPNGVLVIIGGKEDKGQEVQEKTDKDTYTPLEILKTVVELCGKENPVVEVVTTASQVEDEVIEDYRKVFEQLNVGTIGHIHHKKRREVLEDNMKDRIENADIIFFSGGDQLLLTSIYGGTEFLLTIKERYLYNNLVIGGTSAGAMALSTPMIYAGSKEVQQIAGEIKITTGLEFLKDVCIDTHFIDRSRFVRIAQVIATNPGCIGIGIEEDTAIIVREGSKVQVIGSGVITIIEGFSISDTNVADFDKETPIRISDLKVHLLSRGTTYEIPEMNPPHK